MDNFYYPSFLSGQCLAGNQTILAKLAGKHSLCPKYGKPASQLGGLTAKEKQQLASLNYQPGQGVIVYVNHGKSTLNPNAWRTNRVDFASLDSLGRNSAGNTAFLENRNHADNRFRLSQNVDPSGWHPNNGGQLVYNRGHLIAYSLTAGINHRPGITIMG